MRGEVPIHEHLVEQGFVAFVESVGNNPLFYDLKAKRPRRDDPTSPGQPLWLKARVTLAEGMPRGRGESATGPRGSNTWRRRLRCFLDTP